MTAIRKILFVYLFSTMIVFYSFFFPHYIFPAYIHIFLLIKSFHLSFTLSPTPGDLSSLPLSSIPVDLSPHSSLFVGNEIQ